MRLANLFTVNPRNIGDLVSSPALYFPLHAERVNVLDEPRQIDADVILAGGGGLLHADMLLPWLDRNPAATWVSWGIGHNTHGGNRLEWPAWMDRFKLHGVRDWPNRWAWVPCASCWHPAFDEEYKIEHERVVYDHAMFPTGIEGVPTLKNNVAAAADVIAFLASAETVITSSYHGAYWATLLGRKVVVPRPFSSKFYAFKHPPVIGDGNPSQLRCYPTALAECREANRSYFSLVTQVLASTAMGYSRR